MHEAASPHVAIGARQSVRAHVAGPAGECQRTVEMRVAASLTNVLAAWASANMVLNSSGVASIARWTWWNRSTSVAARPNVARIAVKPPSSIALPQKTVDAQGEERDFAITGRHDPCLCPRVVPVAEAMTCLTLADALLRQRAIESWRPQVNDPRSKASR